MNASRAKNESATIGHANVYRIVERIVVSKIRNYRKYVANVQGRMYIILLRRGFENSGRGEARPLSLIHI